MCARSIAEKTGLLFLSRVFCWLLVYFVFGLFFLAYSKLWI